MVTVDSFLASAEGRSNGSTPASGDGLPLQPALTLLIALLIPCVVLLFLLNCVLLLQRLPAIKQERKRFRNQGRQQNPAWDRDLENIEDLSAIVETSSQSPGSHPSQEVRLASGSALSQGVDGVTTVSEGQRTRDGPHSREGLHKPDGTDGGQDACSLQPAIVVTVSKAPRASQEVNVRGLKRLPDRNHGKISQLTVSSCDTEGRGNPVPPNTPVTTPAYRVTPTVKYVRKTSTKRKVRHNPLLIVSPWDSAHFEHASSIPHDRTAIPFSANSSSAGPGLDSDFGASAGVSLRILSSDSDSCSYSWVSGLEWDYYDPGYKRRNQLRMQRHQLPVLCSKQYWV